MSLHFWDFVGCEGTAWGILDNGFVLLNHANGFVGYAELITVKTPRKRMDVELGENALLECTFETTEADTKRLTIFWEFAPSNKIESDQVPPQTIISM